MSGQVYSVTFTTGVIEKLAGIRRPEPPKPAPHPLQSPHPVLPGIPTRPALSPEAARIAQADQQVQRALTASRQVNGLLLKSESEELRRTTEQADALIKEFSLNIKPVPCALLREKCTQCYKDNAKDTLKCSSLVEDYQRCAQGAVERATAK